jgi:hypothetical protein
MVPLKNVRSRLLLTKHTMCSPENNLSICILLFLFRTFR